METRAKVVLGITLGLSIIGIAVGVVMYQKNKKGTVVTGGTDNSGGADSSGGNTSGGGSTASTNSGGGSVSSGGGSASKAASTSSSPAPSGLDLLIANMGASAIKSKDGTAVNAAYNASKNAVSFFNNGRLAIKYVGTSKAPMMGNWSNGGKTLIVNGKTYSNGSVWKNLQDATP